MLSRKSFLIVAAVIISIATVSMSLNKKTERSKAVEMVARLYLDEMNNLDLLLKEYPKYFYDSSYETRKSEYEELARQIKKIECVFYYYHPRLAHEKFFLIGTLEKRDVGPPFPDSWILGGPFGIETDSEMHKANQQQIACMALLEMDSYLHLKKGEKYPATLVTAGMNDPFVVAWQPAKFAARLQADNGSNKPILFWTDYEAGHGMIGMRKSKAFESWADFYSFALWQMGHRDFQLKEKKAF
jgi:hypothetical protein